MVGGELGCHEVEVLVLLVEQWDQELAIIVVARGAGGRGDEVAVVGDVHRELAPVPGHRRLLALALLGVVDADKALLGPFLPIRDHLRQDL